MSWKSRNWYQNDVDEEMEFIPETECRITTGAISIM